MKKIIYIVLSLITMALLTYTGFYTYTNKKTVEIAITATATTTEITATTTEQVPHTKILTTHTGKTITVTETNPVGESLSTITITPSGFATNSPIVIEKNKLTDFFLFDLNKDTFDELVIITTAQGSGSFGEATIFTTTKDKELVLITSPEITEENTKKGSLFEGYMGHDSFSIINGDLVREFPTYVGTDTQSLPTGQRKKVIYSLNERGGVYAITFTKDVRASTTPIVSTTTVLH